MYDILAHIIKYIRCLFLGMNSSFSESILCVWQEKVHILTFVFCISALLSSWLSFSFWDNCSSTAVVGNNTQESWLTLYVAGHSGSKPSSWYWFSLPAVLSFRQNCVCACSHLCMCSLCMCVFSGGCLYHSVCLLIRSEEQLRCHRYVLCCPFVHFFHFPDRFFIFNFFVIYCLDLRIT